MAVDKTTSWNSTQRQVSTEVERLRDQKRLVGRGNRDVVWLSTGSPEDLAVPVVRDRVLVENAGRGDFEGFLRNQKGPFVAPRGTIPTTQILDNLYLYQLPDLRQRAKGAQFKAKLDLLEKQFPGVVKPEYFLHVSPADNGRPCPATEPEETGLSIPWPGKTSQDQAGNGVKVSVVDTGWWPGAARLPWLEHDVDGDREPIGRNLHAYSGHGTFIAGVIRCRAPKAEIHHERFRVIHGGAVRETAIIRQLRQAIRSHGDDPRPHVINLSAGVHTLDGAEPASFTHLWNDVLSQLHNTVLVAAAGNDATDYPFYPAASTWAVGVGSLDRRGGVSNFSNFGVNARVYVVGRNHVNAFPDGRYLCKETPDKGDIRVFETGLARWSGTSFAAPLVTGLLAARIGRKRRNQTARSVTEKFITDIVRIIRNPPEHPPHPARLRLRQIGSRPSPPCPTVRRTTCEDGTNHRCPPRPRVTAAAGAGRAAGPDAPRSLRRSPRAGRRYVRPRRRRSPCEHLTSGRGSQPPPGLRRACCRWPGRCRRPSR